MNITLQNMFLIIFFIITIIVSTWYSLTQELNKDYGLLTTIEINKHAMLLKADELRQSSDDLTKFARMYVSTKNEEYKTNYLNILNIRNGKASRPYNYQFIYWDLFEPTRSQLHPLESPISLKDQIASLPFSKYELKKLKKAEKNSNALSKIEIEAFNALDGLFKDAKGLYTIHAEPNKDFALKLLHSKEYLEHKHHIMLPLDYFLTFLNERNQQKIDAIKQRIHYTIQKIWTLISLSVVVTLLIYLLLYKKLFLPVKSFTNNILSYQEGKEVEKSILHYKDEIGIMIEQFYVMKDKQDKAYENMKELALTDALTGIDNKRVFTELSEKIFSIANRNKKELCVLMLDIDFFKKVNDTYGHLVGDEILKHLANTVKMTLRSSDVFARFGGEEFIILLSETDKESALIKAENIRKIVEETPYVDELYNIVIRLSIGVADKQNEIYFNDLITRADEALYEAKNNGRNQVQAK